MDRKTLLAFVLIAVVLILTPWYMDIVSPRPQEPVGLTEAPTANLKRDISPSSGAPTNRPPPPTAESSSGPPTKELVVENGLYRATVSNKNGGSFASFILNQYDRYDSTLVNLIDGINKNNLLVGFISLDGEQINLNNNWSVVGNPRRLNASTSQKNLLFQTTVNGYMVQKKFTFYPMSYSIDLEVIFKNPDRFVSRGEYTLSWNGGLTSSEKNTKDDHTYFKGYAYLGDELLEPSAKENKLSEENQRGQTRWTAVKSKYFLSAIIPETPGLAAAVSGLIEEGRPVFNTTLVLPVSSGRATLYVGPQDYKTIRSLGVDLEKTMNLGWSIFRPLGRLITWSLTKMYAIVPNYGLVVIIFAFLVKLLLNPLTKQSFISNKKMQAVQPEVLKLKEKHKNDPQKLNRATMKLYKDRGVNPMGGCLPLLLQMPILISFFTVFRSTIEFRGAPFFGWITDLSSPDTLATVGGFPLNVLPVLMGGTMFLQQKLMATPGGGSQQKMMMYFMNVFFLFLFYSFPSGLNLYYSVFNVLSIVQQKYLIPDPRMTGAHTTK